MTKKDTTNVLEIETARHARIALIQSSWHRDIVDQCCDAFLKGMAARDVPPAAITRYEVPGAFEIPLHAKLLATSGQCDIIVAAGFVVDGGIYRHEFVAATVIDALMRVQLETLIPVLSAVLTPQQFHEHAVHERFFKEHMVEKGEEAASACVATLKNMNALRRATADAG